MKKWISRILIVVMLLSLVACSDKPAKKEEPAGTTMAQSAVEALDLQTMLYLLDDMTGLGFGAYCYREEITPDKMSYVLGSEGFDLPFEEGMAYLPTMSTTAFALAVFRLAEGADAQAFAEALEKGADPDRWVCVRAEVTKTAVVGRTVLFVMSNELAAASLKDAFEKMQQPGFRVEAHLVDRLEGVTMDKLYDDLYDKYSMAQYGFMDGEDFGEVNGNTPYGLGDLSTWQYIDSLVDTGYCPAEEFDGERSYLLAMFRLAPEVDTAEFAQELRSCVDTSSLKGEGQQYVLAWKGDVVIYYAGAGSYAWNNAMLQSEFSGIYRMETQGVEP